MNFLLLNKIQHLVGYNFEESLNEIKSKSVIILRMVLNVFIENFQTIKYYFRILKIMEVNIYY